jgi:hypothetical protein
MTSFLADSSHLPRALPVWTVTVRQQAMLMGL